ncbi:MAG: helix-turn-helix domain-containing protein [Anaerovoracaceae bacterium]
MAENREKVLNQKEIGRRVRLRRDYYGLSREQLAEKIEVSSQFITDIEYGHRGMSLETLYKMSQVLQTSADYFLAGKIQEEEDEETALFREEINAALSKCSKEQLKGVSQMIRIYEDGNRMK